MKVISVMITRAQAIDGITNDLSVTTSSGDTYTVPSPVNGDRSVDFSGFGSAVWVDLQFTSTQAWTQDDMDAVDAGGAWRKIASLSNIENLTGSDAADVLRGDADANVLTGGLGDDLLIGRTGDDTFVFADNFGSDTISDFSGADGEKIDLSDVSAITDFADLTNQHIRTDATTGFAEIHAGADKILLNGYTVSDIGAGLVLSETDFLF